MIVVTGGSGFIASNLIKALNIRGRTDIIVVDDLSDSSKVKNLSDLSICDYIDKEKFLTEKKPSQISVVLHQGACADTMATDGNYMMANNYTYSKELYRFCATRGVQYIYASSASVYGDSNVFAEQPQNESALNVYAYSKLLFDQFTRFQSEHASKGFQCVGLRYFNVYGLREQHKGTMASVAWHFFNQYMQDHKVRLFEGNSGYANGEQQRDFIAVEDVVSVNLFFMDHPNISGIYNVGTGRAQSFNEVALAVINTCRRHEDKDEISLEQAKTNGEISYIPMPQQLLGKYQNHTQADLHALRAVSYIKEFDDVATGIRRYVDALWCLSGHDHCS